MLEKIKGYGHVLLAFALFAALIYAIYFNTTLNPPAPMTKLTLSNRDVVVGCESRYSARRGYTTMTVHGAEIEINDDYILAREYVDVNNKVCE
jgi:hypothetical protein